MRVRVVMEAAAVAAVAMIVVIEAGAEVGGPAVVAVPQVVATRVLRHLL